VVVMRHIDDTQMLVEKYCWRAMMELDILDGEFSLDDF
jgi:hypothetical protein